MIEIKTGQEYDGTLKFLGRGSMFNVKEGNTSAFWKDPSDNKTMILIDCGGTVFQKIMEYNLLDGVKNLYVIITHTHTDHIGSLSDLLFYCRYAMKDIKVEVIASVMNMQLIRNFLNVTGFNCKFDTARFNLQAVVGWYNVYRSESCSLYGKHVCSDNDEVIDEHDMVFTIKLITDTSHQVNVGNRLLGKYYNTGIYLYLSESNKRIYYSGDTCMIPYDDIPYIDDIIDEIYVDCAVRNGTPTENVYPHYNLYNMVRDMKENRISKKKVYAMHLDCDGVIDECRNFGVKIVEVI